MRDNTQKVEELFRLMDEICENGDAAVPALEQYVQTQTDPPEVDTEAALRQFEEAHPEIFGNPRRTRRPKYRLFLAAAAVLTAGMVAAAATGHNPFGYAAAWSSELFGFFQDEQNADDVLHSTVAVDDPVPYDPDAPLGSAANPKPVEKAEPLPEYAALPDTDLSDVGLEKTASRWDDLHCTEYFDITNADLPEVLEKFGFQQHMAPTRIPAPYSVRCISVTRDYLLDRVSFFASYFPPDAPDGPGVIVSVDRLLENSRAVVEKDDSPVEEYPKPNATWYIMHNLDQLNAAAIIDDQQVVISAPITVDEMKPIIDSIYE